MGFGTCQQRLVDSDSTSLPTWTRKPDTSLGFGCLFGPVDNETLLIRDDFGIREPRPGVQNALLEWRCPL